MPRRKACDLCYTKKIKCDSQQPRCAACVLYNTPCTYVAASRKTKKRAKPARKSKDCDGKHSSDLEARDWLHTATSSSSRAMPEASLTGADDGTSPDAIHRVLGELGNLDQLSPQSQSLPCLPDAMALIEHYLVNYNALYPLFHSTVLVRGIKQWYAGVRPQGQTMWAAINVALALACRTGNLKGEHSFRSSARYIQSAQSVMSSVLADDTSLLSVQVSLGLAISFWIADQITPAMVLLAAALRLCHRMGLQAGSWERTHSPQDNLQRRRVFWLAYILDRDISMQGRIAPIQLNDDIGIAPPGHSSDDEKSGGVLLSKRGDTRLNIFRVRVELALIQGQVYDAIYSVAAQNANPEEKDRKVPGVLRALDSWHNEMPDSFRLVGQQDVDDFGAKGLCMLYASALQCRALVAYGTFSDTFHYSHWVSQVRRYGDDITAGHASVAPLRSSTWDVLVEESRAFMRLFGAVSAKDSYFLSMTSCAYLTGLVILSCNLIFSTRATYSSHDKLLTDEAMIFMEVLVLSTKSGKILELGSAVRELHMYASIMFDSR